MVPQRVRVHSNPRQPKLPDLEFAALQLESFASSRLLGLVTSGRSKNHSFGIHSLPDLPRMGRERRTRFKEASRPDRRTVRPPRRRT